MPKRNFPTYRLHKPSGRAVVTLNGKDYYLGRHGSKASREEYERVVGEYLANGKKLPPTTTQGGIIGEELAIHFLDWCEGYYRKNGELTQTFGHNKTAVSLFVHHYGNESVNNFTPLSLDFLQKQWIEKYGYTRLTVNRYVCVIKQMFQYGVKYQWVDAQVFYALQAIDSLKAGRTQAPEYKDVLPVDPEIVEKTLQFLPPIVADMVRIQRLCGMRPQDVRNMRSCDIDRTGDVWVYRPFTHKTQHHGKKLAKAVGPRAQAILIPYLIDKQDSPTAFLFSPEDTVRLQRIERRKNRKSFNKKGEVQPSQKDRSKPGAIKPAKQYSRYSYAQAIERACVKAGTTTTITGLSENTEYEFQVRASGNDENFDWSESVYVATDGTSTSHKRRRVLRCTAKTTDSVTLTWPPASNASGYEVQYRQAGTTMWANISIPMFSAWSPNRLRHSAGTETTAQFSLEAAKEFLGHSSIATTEKFYVAPLPELAAAVARKVG